MTGPAPGTYSSDGGCGDASWCVTQTVPPDLDCSAPAACPTVEKTADVRGQLEVNARFERRPAPGEAAFFAAKQLFFSANASFFLAEGSRRSAWRQPARGVQWR